MAKKLQLGYKEIERNLYIFKENCIPAEEVGYELLKAFGKGSRDIARYKEGKGVLKTFDGLLIKNYFCYKAADKLEMTEVMEQLKQDMQVVKAAPKIIAVSDGETLLAYDTRSEESMETPLNRLCYKFEMLYPLGNMERVRVMAESEADVKAAERLARLHDEIRAYNEYKSDDDLHDLNIFISRLLFCFFAEDTGIFEKGLFTNSIRNYTKRDGTDISDYLMEAFTIMDVPENERGEEVNSVISQFPYVNGGLFSKHIPIPKMGQKAREIIISSGELDWHKINPDIFGSMIQAVVNPEERATQGMHYTSVPNIMKVINPLFMEELREEYQKMRNSFDQQKARRSLGEISEQQFQKEVADPIVKKIKALLERMGKMKFFDPACGSGNFLIITYKALRLLEVDLLKLRQECTSGELMFLGGSHIRLEQFFGIELLDFPHEMTMLSLWIAEHQMNMIFTDEFKVNTEALPLHNIKQIVCGNACRIDWESVCPHTPEEEVYVFGNPPYLGSRVQTKGHKSDMVSVMGTISKSLDYISCWFIKAAEYITDTSSQYAFVTTNSICQGEQVGLLWPEILKKKLEISFAYTSFKWSNNAKYNAGVTVVIVGVANKNKIGDRFIIDDTKKRKVDKINPYLTTGSSAIVTRTGKPIANDIPVLRFGSMPNDGGNLILDKYEKDSLLNCYPSLEIVIKKFLGSYEFINGQMRWCIFIPDELLDNYIAIPEIKTKLENIVELRAKSSEKSTRAMAEYPNRFYFSAYKPTPSIIIPAVSSERRDYIPMGLLGPDTVISNAAFAVYDASTWLFGLLTSRMHMVWVRTVGGRLETRLRYSAQLCYNTFPFPKLDEDKRRQISEAAEEVLLVREDYPEKTLADLYDPDKMPAPLLDAHRALDDLVDSCYAGYPFASDDARLEALFKLYEKMSKKK